MDRNFIKSKKSGGGDDTIMKKLTRKRKRIMSKTKFFDVVGKEVEAATSKLVSRGTFPLESVLEDAVIKEKEMVEEGWNHSSRSISEPLVCCIVGDDAFSDTHSLFKCIVGEAGATTEAKIETGVPTLVPAAYLHRKYRNYVYFVKQNMGDTGLVVQIENFESFSAKVGSTQASASGSVGCMFCDFAVVVVNFMQGLQNQTARFISSLKLTKIPFVVALSGVDMFSEWKCCRRYTTSRLLARNQASHVAYGFNTRVSKILYELRERSSICASLVHHNIDRGKLGVEGYINVVPISTLSCEGIADLISILFRVTQRTSSASHGEKAPTETPVAKSPTSHPVKESHMVVHESFSKYQNLDDNAFDFAVDIKHTEHVKELVKLHVLPFLPAKSLSKYRLVSKEWNEWICGLFLAHKQSLYFHRVSGFFCQDSEDITFMTLNASIYGIPSPSLAFLPQPVVIRNSCNGLLLCQGRDDENVYYVCNPANKEFDVLPKPTYFHGNKPKLVLAFEPSPENFVAEYQVICPIVSFEQTIYFEVYDSRTRSWKCCPAGDGIKFLFSDLKDGFYMSGQVYWEVLSGEYLCVDVRNELCNVHPGPPGMRGGFLSQVNGRLCYLHPHLHHEVLCIDFIFVNDTMSLNYSVSIPKELLPGLSSECELLPCVSSDFLMIFSGGDLHFYELKYRNVELVSRAAYQQSFKYFPYVNSLVCLEHQQQAISR